jgi:hypothetical protein
MIIQPMRKKTPVSVHSSWPMQGTTVKRSNPSNSASFQDIENLKYSSMVYIFKFK